MVRKWKWSMLAYTGFRVCPNRNPGLGEALDAPARSSKVPQLRARQVLRVDLPKQVYGLGIRDMGFGESRVKVVVDEGGYAAKLAVFTTPTAMSV